MEATHRFLIRIGPRDEPIFMLRIVVAFVLSVSPAVAQVTQQDESIHEQLVPESFRLEASAVAEKINWWWSTTITYSLTNNSGMNLYFGIMMGGVTYGSCTQVRQANGSLPLLPSPRARVYSAPAGSGPPTGMYVPTGSRASGAIVMANCGAPNPGHPTAPLSISLMGGKTPEPRTMTSFPLAIDAPIQQLPEP